MITHRLKEEKFSYYIEYPRLNRHVMKKRKLELNDLLFLTAIIGPFAIMLLIAQENVNYLAMIYEVLSKIVV